MWMHATICDHAFLCPLVSPLTRVFLCLHVCCPFRLVTLYLESVSKKVEGERFQNRAVSKTVTLVFHSRVMLCSILLAHTMITFPCFFFNA